MATAVSLCVLLLQALMVGLYVTISASASVNVKTSQASMSAEELLGDLSTRLVIRLAQCRANCLEKFSKGTEYERNSTEPFVKSADMFMEECWTACRQLEYENNTETGTGRNNWICPTNSSLCLIGCQEACRFHGQKDLRQEATLRALPVSATLSLQPNGTLHWPAETGPYLVYTVVGHTEAGSWVLLGQTKGSNIQLLLPVAIEEHDLRVLVVSPEGLQRVLRLPDTYETSLTSDPWHLTLNSLVHQKWLVLAELSWNVQPLLERSAKIPAQKPTEMRAKNPAERSTFLLTWEVDGGLVRGNLVTDRRAVTISLWPDSTYSLQVGLIDQGRLNGSSESVHDLEALLSAEGQLPVSRHSRTLFLNTSLATYPGSQRAKVRGHDIPLKGSFKACILIWSVLVLCLLTVFLMLVYFTVSVYRHKKTLLFRRLPFPSSVSTISREPIWGERKIGLLQDQDSTEDSSSEEAEFGDELKMI